MLKEVKMVDSNNLNITVAKEVKELLKPGVLVAENVQISEATDYLWAEIDEISEKYCEMFRDKMPSDIYELSYARDLYKAIGVNPTKTRPSSEALLRRIMQNKELYRINNLVDTWNLESLEFFLPVGLYDIDKIASTEISIRKGNEGEFFEGIRKSDVNVGDRLCIADSEGPFGSPTSDSMRTAITDKTTRVLVLIYAPAHYPEESLFRMLDEGARRTKQYCFGKIVSSRFIPRV